ncbi:MAG: response regulator [Acidobacteriia bacterium]|nr:response regulator [Terriglobia bacterium]
MFLFELGCRTTRRNLLTHLPQRPKLHFPSDSSCSCVVREPALSVIFRIPFRLEEIVSLKGPYQGTILVADDNESIRDPLTEMLRLQGYRVIAVDNGEQALQEICSQPVDLALLDVMMPGQSGFAVCRAVKSRPETRLIPIVLVTGLGSADDRIRGIEAGADDFLNKPVKKEELLARVRSLVRLKRFTDELDNAETVLCTLARSIEAKDPYTEGHCDRLSRYTVSLGETLGLSGEQLVALRRGGIVHDIGKVAVPEFVLLKPGPLDAAERKIMEQHTIAGERICAPLKSFRNVLPIIRSHHEKQDGTGYPDHLKGRDIPLTARILQTVDIYDSLTTDRPYRKALSQETAIELMWEETRRGWWDPDLVGALQGLLQESPLAFSTSAA